MASTATITPTLGAAPVTLQAGNYSAIDDRRFWGAGVREGVLAGGSYQVIQRAAGANMTVDVQSSVGGGAIVQGDSVTAQGNYMVPPTAANVNVDITAADATNPRNDLVVLEVKDDQHDASALNIARVRVITGTANASAGATDAPGVNGTPALPSSCLLLAHIRVTAGATSVTTAMINDRRPWAWTTPTYETSLPSPGVDGQEIYYRADNTNGVIWHLRFRNVYNGGSASYPWEYVGGPALHAVNTSTVSTASTTYVTLTPGSGSDPAITVPLAGDYDIEVSALAGNDNANGAALCTYRIATGAEAADGLSANYYGAGALVGYSAPYVVSRATGIAASSSINLRYRSNSAGTSYFLQRRLRVRPVRVG